MIYKRMYDKMINNVNRNKEGEIDFEKTFKTNPESFDLLFSNDYARIYTICNHIIISGNGFHLDLDVDEIYEWTKRISSLSKNAEESILINKLKMAKDRESHDKDEGKMKQENND